MSGDKYPSIFSRQMKAVVYILQILGTFGFKDENEYETWLPENTKKTYNPDD